MSAQVYLNVMIITILTSIVVAFLISYPFLKKSIKQM